MFSALGLMGLLQTRLKKSYFEKSMLEWLKIPNLFLFSLAFMSRISSAMRIGRMTFIFSLVSIIFEALEYCAFFKRNIHVFWPFWSIQNSVPYSDITYFLGN